MKQGGWLLREDTLRELANATGALGSVTPDMRKAFDDKLVTAFAARSADGPPNLRIAADVAEIDVVGILTEEPDFWLWFLGYANTAYADVREAITRAQGDPNVKRLVLRVNSPGGNVDGLFETLAALQAVSKPMTAVSKMACSAAYAIATTASHIEADMAAACFGSVGVVASYYLRDNQVDITSTEAPNKRPDLRTEEGKQVVRKQLDDLHDLFVDAIAAGRKTSKERVNAEFGRGGVFLAAEALRVGMVDSIKSTAAKGAAPATATASTSVGAQKEKTPMDLKTLKAQHSDVFDQAHAEGVAAERKRAKAHLILGKQCGNMEIAVEAISSGADLDAEYQAKYMAAGMKRETREERQAETDAAAKVVAGAAPVTATDKDIGDDIVALLDKKEGR